MTLLEVVYLDIILIFIKPKYLFVTKIFVFHLYTNYVLI